MVEEKQRNGSSLEKYTRSRDVDRSITWLSLMLANCGVFSIRYGIFFVIV